MGRAITLWEPYASLIKLGYKQFETRSWATNYCGELLIHAAKRPVKMGEATVLLTDFAELGIEKEFRDVLDQMKFGCIIAKANLVSCHQMQESEPISDLERTVGLWEKGRYAWRLECVEAIEPIYCQGKQGLWIPK